MKLKLKAKGKFLETIKPSTKRGEYKTTEQKKSKPYSFRLDNKVDAELQKKAGEMGILTVHLIQSLLKKYAEELNPDIKTPV